MYYFLEENDILPVGIVESMAKLRIRNYLHYCMPYPRIMDLVGQEIRLI